jgi:Family of unknown function (DUF6535)
MTTPPQACVISPILVWRIVYNIRNLSQLNAAQHVAVYEGLYAAVLSRISPETPSMVQRAFVSSMPDPTHFVFDWSPSRVIRVNVFWIASLVFCLSAAGVATFAIQIVRQYKHTLVLQQYGRLLNNARIQSSSIEHNQLFINFWMDPMYRLLQVAFVMFFLGHVDALVTPVDITVLAAVTICGLRYVYGAFG